MKKIIISSLAVASLLSITSCKTDFDTDVADITPVSGEADFSNYVALGNSLTSGYRDGTLYIDGQNESYPLMIAEQMQKAGGGAFTQPLMQDNIGGFANIPNFKGKLELKLIKGNLSPVEATATKNIDRLSGKFNNMGVPGVKIGDLTDPNYVNPFFMRFASSPSTTIMADAMTQNPTFFSLWIGNNDVLGYATSGGDGSDPITPTATFHNAYNNLLRQLTSKGAKGVVANIPNVADIPFFTTVPYNPIPLDEATATQLNTQLVNRIKAVLTAFGQGDRFQTLSAGQNPLLIIDESLANLSAQITSTLSGAGLDIATATFLGNTYGQARHATKEDLILLTTRSVINTDKTGVPAPFNKLGITYPLEDKLVLTKAEVAEIKTATESYNTKIKELANQYNLAFVDANAKMVELSKNSGISYNGVTYTTTFVTGGAFSLDGVHLTGRGYAVIANEFIKAINTKYGSTLPQVNPNKYSGVKFP